MRSELFSAENLETYASTGHKPDGDWLHIGDIPGLKKAEYWYSQH